MSKLMEASRGRPAVLMPQDATARERIEAMVRAHFPAVWRTLRRMGLSDADADDGAQQVFLTTARKLEQIDPSRERAFVLGVAVRVAADARKANRRRRLEPPTALQSTTDPAPNPEQVLEQQRACELLDSFLATLDADAREVFALYEIEALTMREIASALGKPAGTIASRLRRGRAQFEAAVSRYQAKPRKASGSG